MRLFTGIALPESVIEELTRLLDRLRPAAHLNWSPPYNLHITTEFIGQWPENRLDELTSVLRPAANRPAIDISIAGIGWIPNRRSPRILYAGVKADESLAKLAEDIDMALGGLGIERENRKFSPHLTLARIKDPAVSLTALRAALEKVESAEFGQFTASGFHLYLSKPGPAGSIYTQLAEFPFTQE
jgi:RNA 2',3'-cyclic 3'-phosphodiesterase